MSLPGKNIEKAFEEHVINGFIQMLVQKYAAFHSGQNLDVKVDIQAKVLRNRLIQVSFQGKTVYFSFLYSSTGRYHKENLPSYPISSSQDTYVCCCCWGEPVYKDVISFGERGAFFYNRHYCNLAAKPGEYYDDSVITIIKKDDLRYVSQTFDPVNIESIKLTDIPI